jgi:hypothetical protein
MTTKILKKGKNSTISSLFAGIVVIMAMFIVVGCEKDTSKGNSENVESSNATVILPEIQYDGRMLVFNTSDDYGSYVNNPDSVTVVSLTKQTETLGFESYYSKCTEVGFDKNNDIIQDDYLASILNEDCIVQIGEYLYRVNVASESVYVMSSQFIELYEDLVNEDITNKNIMKFSTDEDVIDLVENGLDGCKDCGGCGSGSYYTNEIELKNQAGTTVVTAVGKVRYYTAGIYFKLSVNGEYYPEWWEGTIRLQIFVQTPEAWWQKRPCCNDCDYESPSGIVYSSTVSHDVQVVYYSNMRALHGYYLYEKVKIIYENPEDPLNGEFVTSNWAGRSVNSPY